MTFQELKIRKNQKHWFVVRHFGEPEIVMLEYDHYVGWCILKIGDQRVAPAIDNNLFVNYQFLEEINLDKW